MRKLCVKIPLFITIMTVIITILWIDKYIKTSKRRMYSEYQITTKNDVKHANWTLDHEKYLGGFTNSLDEGYLEYVRTNWIYAPTFDDRNTTVQSDHDESEVGQSKFVAKLLEYKENGFFVESGAGDGYTMSNSIYLETKLKWTGILIDPQLQINKKLRRRAFKSKACLSTKPVSQNNVKFINNGYWSKIYMIKNTSRKTKFIKVQCFPLDALLNSLNIKHVDYLSLDIEGEELAVLETLNFEKIYIDVISVEYRVSIGTPEAPFIDFESTRAKLNRLRIFFKSTNMYVEVGILPKYPSNTKYQEEYGLDVFFKRNKDRGV